MGGVRALGGCPQTAHTAGVEVEPDGHSQHLGRVILRTESHGRCLLIESHTCLHPTTKNVACGESLMSGECRVTGLAQPAARPHNPTSRSDAFE